MERQLFEKLLSGLVGTNPNNNEKPSSGEDMLRQLVGGFLTPNTPKEENKRSPSEGLNLNYLNDIISNVSGQSQKQSPVAVPNNGDEKLLNNMNSGEGCVTPQYTWNIHYPSDDTVNEDNKDEDSEDDEEVDVETEKVYEEINDKEEEDEFVKLLRETTRKGREQKKEKLRKAIDDTKERMMEVARKGVNCTTIDLSGEEEWIASEIEDYFSGLGITCVLYDNRLSLDWSE